MNPALQHALLPNSTERTKRENSSQLNHTEIPIYEIINNTYRMDASYFGIAGRQAREGLKKSKYGVKNLCGKAAVATAYHRPRFKRIFVKKSKFGIYQPSQISEVYPKPAAYISHLTETDIDKLRVKRGQVLMTCSGTVGKCTYVSDTLNGCIFSHDVIRIQPQEYNGYIYAYLKSKTGSTIVNTNVYGAVIKHIEPVHLNDIPIPDPPSILKQAIHDLIVESFRLRDESNQLMDTAQRSIAHIFKFLEFEQCQNLVMEIDQSVGIANFSASLDSLDCRLDGSYHNPIVNQIEKHLEKHAGDILRIKDRRISNSVNLPGQFKRVYVEAGNGVVFIGGKQIYELDPHNKKYLSYVHHKKRIDKELILSENMILITCSGTIGKVNIVPKHWCGWTASQHVIRVVPASKDIAGYLYAWLASDYALPLITRYSYGAVVDEINDKQISRIAVPIPKDTHEQRLINRLVLEANQKRAEAFVLEQKALNILSDKVIAGK